jgi:hypothetical protein
MTAWPVLPALLHPFTQGLLESHASLVHELVDGLGSPLHLMLPQAFAGNAAAFQSALREAGVDGMVLYAKKANKARCLAEIGRGCGQRCGSHCFAGGGRCGMPHRHFRAGQAPGLAAPGLASRLPGRHGQRG